MRCEALRGKTSEVRDSSSGAERGGERLRSPRGSGRGSASSSSTTCSRAAKSADRAVLSAAARDFGGKPDFTSEIGLSLTHIVPRQRQLLPL